MSHATAVASRHGLLWDEDEERTALRMASDGWDTWEIAAALGRTFDATDDKIRRARMRANGRALQARAPLCREPRCIVRTPSASGYCQFHRGEGEG